MAAQLPAWKRAAASGCFLLDGAPSEHAPKVNKDVLICVIPLAAIHALGNVLTNLSLSVVAVSFTHTIKVTLHRAPLPCAHRRSRAASQALEPFFSVIMSWAFLGSVPSAAMVVTLLPIVLGVILASISVRTRRGAPSAAPLASLRSPPVGAVI